MIEHCYVCISCHVTLLLYMPHCVLLSQVPFASDLVKLQSCEIYNLVLLSTDIGLLFLFDTVFCQVLVLESSPWALELFSCPSLWWVLCMVALVENL